MKNNRIQPQKRNMWFDLNSKQPANRDELDSRRTEEQDFKGDDVTHDKKPVQSRPPKNRH